jgi:hypothetical protein
VGKCAASLFRKLEAEITGEFFSFFFFLFHFPWFIGLLLQAGALMWSHQVTGLWVVFGSFCPQGRLQLGPEVTHCQFMQVFGAVVVCTMQQLCCPTTATLVSSSASKVGQFSFEYLHQSDQTSSGIHHWLHFGWLACHPTLALSLCTLPYLCLVLVWFLWEVSLPPHPCS